MPDLLIASLAPLVVLPVCLGGPVLWRLLAQVHHALGWAGRSIVAVLGLKLVTDVVILLGR